MSHQAKKPYLIAIYDRYQKASKKEKSRILNEFCAVCNYRRKVAIRLLNFPISPIGSGMRGSKVKYVGPVIEALRDIWCLTGKVCSKRLKEAMPEWFEFYLQRPNSLTNEDINMLKDMSISTMDRKLASFRKLENKGKFTTRKSNWWFRSHVPIQAGNEGITTPGFVQSDTAAHCGTSIAGNYAHTVTATDVFTTALDPFGANISFGLKFFVTDSGFLAELILVLGIVPNLEGQRVS